MTAIKQADLIQSVADALQYLMVGLGEHRVAVRREEERLLSIVILQGNNHYYRDPDAVNADEYDQR